MDLLRENQKLESIWWSDGLITVGNNGVEYILVSMESGQMGMVPWVEVIFEDGRVNLYNLALCKGVQLRQRREGE